MTGSLEDVLERLYSDDANERVKAANQIGEVGGPKEAPIVLKVVYEDDASTVRQMAIQSYYEILKDDAFEELKNVILNHEDDYVKIYALSVLEKFPISQTKDIFLNGLKDENPRIRATIIKSVLHSDSRNLADQLLSHLEKETDELVVRNIIECFGLWKYKLSKDYLQSMLTDQNSVISDPENYTILLFALSALGEKSALKMLEEDDVDEFIRIKHDDIMYRGKQGMLDLLKKI